ncbi:uncharacterized protein LOC112041880, partial [Lingula anatina]|uniref:Uncharacterized protein LOC112041880 n=1 Tax=Lingula anatina TaxID=7574 RepID=A0A2R2MMG1_LINAN
KVLLVLKWQTYCVEDITKESAQNCDFCEGSYKRFTALDPFGRVESKHSYSVANAFKYDRWHSLVLLRNHHPLKWTEEEFLDMANTGLSWMKKVNAIQKDYVYPIIFWDLLPHAMASQIHPHMHVNVRPDQYYGAQELWRRAGETYFREFRSNYFKELKELHQALGLTVDLGTATAFANLNPKHETEIIVLSRTPNTDFFRLIYYVLRTYLDDLDQLCFSMAITLPSLVPDSYINADRGRMPAFARITSRGSASSVKGDLSSMEMYGVSNVNMEPWTMIQHVQQSVNKRSVGG